MFEDAPSGVEAALSAGMQVVWVPDRNCVEALARTANNGPQATLTLSSLQDFDPRLFGLPAFSQ